MIYVKKNVRVLSDDTDAFGRLARVLMNCDILAHIWALVRAGARR
jgi:hypothetical protein